MRCYFRLCGKLLFWSAMLVGLAGAAALLWIMHHLDEAVRSEVQETFAEHYHDLHVAVRSAHRVEGEGLFIRGLSIKDPSLEGPQSELLYVDEVFLQTSSSIDELVLGDVEVQHVALRRLALRAVRRADGTWSVARLLPLPRFGGPVPTASVEDGTVEIFDPNRTPASSLTLRRINLQVEPQLPDASSQTPSSQAVLHVGGNATSDVFARTDVAGWLDPVSGQWEVRGTTDRLVVAPETWQALPASLAQHLTRLGNLRGKAGASFHVRNRDVNGIPYEFDVQGRIVEGGFEDPRLPFPLEKIQADVHLNNAGVKITDLTAHGDGATLRMSLTRDGWQPGSPLRLDILARRLHLEPAMRDALPPPMQRLWDKFQPAGLLDADMQLTFDGEHWQPEISARCQSLSLVYDEFPYPLSGTTGTITLHDDVLHYDLRAMAADAAVHFKGRVVDPAGRPTGWMEFECEGPVPIDQRLLTALEPKMSAARRVLASLRARGNVLASGRLERRSPEQTGLNEHVKIHVSDGSVQYEKFPYPLRGIRGDVEVWNGQWQFRNFSGRNDSGQVTCRGSLTGGENGRLLALDLVATDLPLEDELRGALPPEARKIWSDLRPRGTLDRVTVDLNFRPDHGRCDVKVAAQKWPESAGETAQSISLFPKAFPYRLNHVIGKATYCDGHLEFQQVRAEHGKARVTTSGFCQTSPAGDWRLQFTRLNVEQLTVDRELIAAMPPGISATLAGLNITGPVALGGAMEFRGTGRRHDGVASDWDLSLDLENGRLECGVLLENVHGAVRLLGSGSPEHFYSRGELAIDSLIFQGFQFTQITGPLWIDRRRVSLGAWAEQPHEGQPPRHIEAQILGGHITSDFHLAMDNESHFTLQAKLDGADLSRLAREMMPRQRSMSGQASGMLRLTGYAHNRDTLRGDGQIWLRSADIYQLPVMVALLKIISVNKPLNTTAFTSSDIEFRVNGEKIYFDRIVFNGDAISLKGTGELSLDRRIDLQFYTLMGSESRRIPLIWPLLADASRRILMIEVTGTLENPVTKRNVLPGLNSTLQQLFSEELGNGPGDARTRRRASDLRPSYRRH